VFDLQAIAPPLSRDDQGFWTVNRSMVVDYPQTGHDATLRVQEKSFWYQHRNQCILALLKRFDPHGPIFDIGGSNGYVARCLVDAGYETVLVEPGKEGVMLARQRGLDPIVWGALDDVGFLPGSLPAVSLFDVIEHIEDDLEFMKTVERLLRPGGRVFITVPAYSFLWSQEDELAMHYRRYTLGNLKRLILSAGLEPEYGTYMFTMLPMPIFLMRTVAGKFKRRRSEVAVIQEKDHLSPQGMTGAIMRASFGWEPALISKGRILPVGSSCMMVARKRKD